MLLDKLFGNVFGIVWLIIVMICVLVLIYCTIFKEKKVELKKDDISSEYLIEESKDGFFRVRKKDSERTIRKLASKEEAINFIKEKESKK